MRPRLETQVSTRIADIMIGFLKGLPRIWLAKIGARRLLGKLPEYEEDLKLPNSDEIFEWVKGLCKSPHRRPGTPEGHEAERWVAKKLEEFGLKNVTVDPIPISVWNAKRWSLKVEGHEIPSFFVVNMGFTPSEGVTSPLVYVGTGTRKDFSKVDVASKIVVADVTFPFIPTGALVKLFQISGALYHLSDPEHSLTLRSGQYLNFVRQNFIGGSTRENAPPTDVYWQAYHRGARAICLILRDQPSNSNDYLRELCTLAHKE